MRPESTSHCESIDESSVKYLEVKMPNREAFRWITKLVALAWMPFGAAIGGRWFSSVLGILASSLLAYALVQVGKNDGQNLPIPETLINWIRASKTPLATTLTLALAITIGGRILETLVEWCLTWTHLKVNLKLTPEVIEASVEPSTRRLLDPPTAVQRWLLKLDISYFICDSLAATIGHVGTVLIIVFTTFKANAMAGQVALGGLILWIAAAFPLMIQALGASQRAAHSHEEVGRIIRDSAALRAELSRPSLREYWRVRCRSPIDKLHNSIKQEGLWNAALFGSLGIISQGLPIVAVLAASATMSIGTSFAVLLYLTRMAGPLSSLANSLPWIQRNLIAVQRAYQVVESDREHGEEAPAAYNPSCVVVHEWKVLHADRFQISYPELALQRGGILSVVGPSGSGKSSLLESLAGHLQAKGSLLVDGELVSVSNSKWMETCAFVRQEPELVPGQFLDNFHCYPRWKETPTLAKAVAAVTAARYQGSHGDVSIDDKGMSVGQRRVLSVVRAVGSDAPVLLLDEPFAGVDEALVRPLLESILEAARGGKLVLLTAHQHDVERLTLSELSAVLHLPPIKFDALT